MNRRICLNFPSLRDFAKQNRGNSLDFLTIRRISRRNLSFSRELRSRRISKILPLPCGGGLRGWVDSANAESVKLSCEAPLISPASWCKKSDSNEQ
ncbi:hypothetical protein [Helicobacter sp. 23-1045]